MRVFTVPESTSLLRQKSQPIKSLNTNLAEFLIDLGSTLKRQHDPEGIGLSAIQIGRLIRVFALDWKYLKKLEKSGKSKVVYYINPEIISHSKEKTLGDEINKGKPFLEGCLSVPNLYGEVNRWPEIKVRAAVIEENELKQVTSYKLQVTSYEFERLAARVIQHEIDHLNGVLFTDHVLRESGQLYRWDGEELIKVEL